MNKVICEICGTSYPETAEQCPICGYTQDMSAALRQELETGELPAAPSAKGGSVSPSNGSRNDSFEMDGELDGENGPEVSGELEYDDEPRESSALLVMLLVVVITALLAVTVFIGFKYVLPNILPEETTIPEVTTVPPTTEETQAPTVPCTNLVLTSGGTVRLEKEGQYWLLNVVILPVDSTDKLTYESSDETVAIVNAEGRVTAVGNGEAVITIRCGEQALQCRIICDIPEETTVPETTEDEEATDSTDETDATEETDSTDQTDETEATTESEDT